MVFLRSGPLALELRAHIRRRAGLNVEGRQVIVPGVWEGQVPYLLELLAREGEHWNDERGEKDVTHLRHGAVTFLPPKVLVCAELAAEVLELPGRCGRETRDHVMLVDVAEHRGREEGLGLTR